MVLWCKLIFDPYLWNPSLEDTESSKPLKLTFSGPAKHWTDAIPIGNGRLGAMVWGGVKEETLQLNGKQSNQCHIIPLCFYELLVEFWYQCIRNEGKKMLGFYLFDWWEKKEMKRESWVLKKNLKLGKKLIRGSSGTFCCLLCAFVD